MNAVVPSIQNTLPAYGFHFLRTVFVVGLNLFIARALLSSELFGDFRVAVKFIFILGSILFAFQPVVSRLLSRLSQTKRTLAYAALLLLITALMNGSYIIGRNIIHDWSLVDYLNHHPIHILMPGVVVFVLLQFLAKMLSQSASGSELFNRLTGLSYLLFAAILGVTLVLLPELNLMAIISIFLLSQILLLAIGWSVYQFMPATDKKQAAPAATSKTNLMFQSGLAVSLFALELFAQSEIVVTHFAIIMILVSLLFVTTLPLDNAMRRINHWSRDLTPSFVKVVWVNAIFTSFMFMLLMPMSRYLLGWLDGGIVIDVTANEPMLMPLRFALAAFLLISWLRPFFSVLLRFDAKLAKRLQVFKLIVLVILLILLIPPYQLYGALFAELLSSLAVYGFVVFYLFDHGAFSAKEFLKFDI